MAFRPELTALKTSWTYHFGASRASDGFLLIAELRVPRIASAYPPELKRAFNKALTAIAKSLKQPIRYAGPGGTQFRIFRHRNQ
jgi:hypothetical protein